MKTLFVLFLYLIFSLASCGNNNSSYKRNESNTTHLNLSRMATPLSINDIAGNWRGSYTDKEFGFRLAIKLMINKDGSFKRVFYGEGKLMDSAIGKTETFIEKDENTDNYGENKDTTYLHGIRLIFNTTFGLNYEVYQISPDFDLIPRRSTVDPGNDVVLTREN